MSVALPGSILDNAQSAELRTYLAGQVARALAVFSIDEVVVFSDDKDQSKEGNSQLVNILKFLGKPNKYTFLRRNLLFQFNNFFLCILQSVLNIYEKTFSLFTKT